MASKGIWFDVRDNALVGLGGDLQCSTVRRRRFGRDNVSPMA